MMEVFIKSNPNTPTGYELVDGDVTTPITKSVVEKKTGILWLSLPTNSTGRTLANEAKVRAANGKYILTPKADRSNSTMTTTTTKKSTIEEDAKAYLSEDEYETFKKLIGKIEYNRQVKALEAQIKALEEQKAKLMEGGDK
jgi:hypothetical protein